MPRLFKKEEGSVGLHWYKGRSFMWNLVQFMIYFKLFHHRGKFKVGDKVRYNWKAWVRIKSALWGESDKGTLTVSEVLYKDKSNVGFEEGGGCDVFWIRKAFFWER
jgi:hypothetical protein